MIQMTTIRRLRKGPLTSDRYNQALYARTRPALVFTPDELPTAARWITTEPPMRAYAERTDANQPEIMAFIRAQGGECWFISRPFDLLVVYQGEIAVWEVKGSPEGTRDGELNTNQKLAYALMKAKGYEVPIIRSIEDAQAAMEAMQ